MPDAQAANGEKPPYLSLTTLLNFFDRWGEGPIPPRIDKSALDNYSGGTQSLLMSTLRLIGYVDAEGAVLPALREAVRDEGLRKAHLSNWSRHFYGEQLALAEQNATPQMLHESFAEYGYTGSTLRKAVVFYLALVDYLGLPNSPHFRPPKQSATPYSKRRAKPTPTGRTVVGDMSAPVTAYTAPRGETTVVKIDGLATITITVDAQWMKLPIETITTMREAIANLEGLGTRRQDQA
jgi:hypothetical protein